MASAPDETRTGMVVRAIRDRIDARTLTPGARLPSIRAMAETSGVARSTVVEAYDRLAAEGVIRSRPGSGFYVAAPLAPLALDRLVSTKEREVDPLWMLRQSLGERRHEMMPGCGWLPDDWLAGDALRKAMRRAARSDENGTLAGYASPLGSPPLRALLARRMADQGIEAGPDQILLTDSGTHALDLVCRFLLQPGDTVLVDDPCYFNFLALLRAHRATVVGVPMTPTGPDVTAFTEAAATHRPRFYLTNSGVHNPTGASLAAATAHRLLKIAEAHDMVVVEDDIFADFEHTPSPRLAAFDGLDRTIRIGSFSKSLSAAVRCGHIAARPDWIEGLADLRIATSMAGSPLAANLLHAVLTDGSYRRHVDGVRTRLARAMARVAKRLRAIGIEPWTDPAAGIFLWARLPDSVDAVELARKAINAGIVLAPGPVFSTSGGWRDHLRFNVAMSDDDRLYAFLESAVSRPLLEPAG
ncbi:MULTISPECIES: PLP-dependent aminotransferase family protein [Sphingomonas]|uniref:Putative GntR family transcriptional regulator n=1 Tax=Sphingomonas parapaucimobilis NBRC 15100 TaxID=1219049 RepID=A0A0A1WB68_9SPHN|nr:MULTISPECIES: PLP-dependent aminotransferase family protein [Sphingomonas]MDQ1231006.1 DNA-binding transcriptional MocR family regulator [Sphingomonas sp. SORGH_AS_0879]GAM02705.1 putative GntR family transcriptional regulator [Sphingomonas parapaucimobilis NBRC 15100]